MSAIEHKIDRTGWDAGPWDLEPEDRREWRAHGFPCLMLRNSSGVWCGYLGLPAAHPWAKVRYQQIDAVVHGGLTFGPEPCNGKICHVPQDGESDDVRWIGFDCGHAWDVRPGSEALERGYGMMPLRMPDQRYRTAAYVADQVEGLAMQAAEARR